MFPLFLRKFNILKKQNIKPVQRQIKSVQTKPLQKDFRCTKDLFSYAKKRCIDALNNEAPYEHVVIADIKKNKVLTEFIGEENKCNIEGIENFNLDKENTVVIHGHSDSTPISVCDMYTLLKNNLRQIIAVDKKGQFSLVAKSPNMSNNIDAKYKKYAKEHYELTDEMTQNNVYELYNIATDYVLKKHTPLMGLRYISNYDYLRK